MRRPISLLSTLLFCFIVVSIQAVPQEGNQSKDIGENALMRVENRAAVPDRYRPGFASMTERDSRTLLSFLASDLLEGRETGSRGYRLAAEYAASLFAFWGLEPAGDMGETAAGAICRKS